VISRNKMVTAVAAIVIGTTVFALATSGNKVRVDVQLDEQYPPSPSLAFDRALGGLDSIGKVESTNITSSEVTAQYVDMESRSKTLRAATERIRTLLATASRTEIVSLEGELAKRESELSSIEGQMNPIALVVAMAMMSFRGVRRNRQARALSYLKGVEANNTISDPHRETSKPAEKELV
jgi:hypothetical protein